MFGRKKLRAAKPRLISVKVPWAVAADTPYLRLTASESPVEAHVRFVAFFALGRDVRTTQTPSQVGFARAEVFYPPHDSNIKRGPPSGPDQVIKVSFDQAVEARMVRAFSDASAIDYSAFDCSALFDPNEYVEDIKRWLTEYHQEWRRTGFCPDPRMYEVEGSAWLGEYEHHGWKHYIIVGHDAYVEVLAKDWKWESEGSLRGSHGGMT